MISGCFQVISWCLVEMRDGNPSYASQTSTPPTRSKCLIRPGSGKIEFDKCLLKPRYFRRLSIQNIIGRLPSQKYLDLSRDPHFKMRKSWIEEEKSIACCLPSVSFVRKTWVDTPVAISENQPWHQFQTDQMKPNTPEATWMNRNNLYLFPLSISLLWKQRQQSTIHLIAGV